MKNIVYILLAIITVSCVYPYDAEIEENYGNMVIEGDIFVGSKSVFELSYLMPLTGNQNRKDYRPNGSVWVEASDGTRYEGEQTDNQVFEVDTRNASPALQYRVHVYDALTYLNYVSDWSSVGGTCVIDDFHYEISEDKQTVSLKIGLHSDDGSHFRYRYSEDWEYTSDYRASQYYIPETSDEFPFGIIKQYVNGENSYYCWNSDASRGINLATTEDMSEDVLVNYPVITYDNHNKKISQVYRMDIEVYPVDADSYAYYDHLKQMSELSGNLFSPTPSEMRGNISCEENPNQYVYGYVAVVQPASSRLYFNNKEESFYVRPYLLTEEAVDVPKGLWYTYYSYEKYLLYAYSETQGALWLPRDCIDCTRQGGTKNKPEDWPNDHK